MMPIIATRRPLSWLGNARILCSDNDPATRPTTGIGASHKEEDRLLPAATNINKDNTPKTADTIAPVLSGRYSKSSLAIGIYKLVYWF